MNNMRKNCTGEHILSKEKRRQLIKTCEQTDKTIEYKFVVLMLVKLGLRIAEIAHIEKNWVDFEHGIISIPSYKPCACSYCRAIAKKRTEYKYISKEEIKKYLWQPKSKSCVRNISFSSYPEVKDILIKFFTKYEKCPFTVNEINKLIVDLGELAGLKNVFPHALRATAAVQFAIDGANAETIQAIMGWKDISIANTYVRMAGKQAAESIDTEYDPEKGGI